MNKLNDISYVFDDDLLSDDIQTSMYLDDSYGNPNYENEDDILDGAETVVNNQTAESIEEDIFNDSTNYDDDVILEVLKERGFNPDAIKLEDENGEIKSYKFNELSKEDQISLLNSEDYDTDDEDFTDSDLEAVEFLRSNNLTLKELVKQVREDTIKEVSQAPVTYTVDDFSDEELYLADFRNKYGEDFTDDELLIELEKAKEDEDLFSKKINKLRADYKAYEDQTRQEEEFNKKAELEKQHEEYVQTMVNVARNYSSMHDTVEIDDNTREEILQYMFDKDNTGLSKLQKAFNNPDVLFKVAWYLKHGDDTINELHKYYQNELKKQAKPAIPQTVIKQKTNQHTNNRPMTIQDLY